MFSIPCNGLHIDPFQCLLRVTLITIKMADRKMLESFSQKLDADSKTLSLQNQRKQKVTNFIISLNNIFTCCSLAVLTSNTTAKSY